MFLIQMVEALGGCVEFHDLGTQHLPDGSTLPLPPVLTGQIGNDPKKKTVCIYGHLDVQPAFITGKFHDLVPEFVSFFKLCPSISCLILNIEP